LTNTSVTDASATRGASCPNSSKPTPRPGDTVPAGESAGGSSTRSLDCACGRRATNRGGTAGRANCSSAGSDIRRRYGPTIDARAGATSIGDRAKSARLWRSGEYCRLTRGAAPVGGNWCRHSNAGLGGITGALLAELALDGPSLSQAPQISMGNFTTFVVACAETKSCGSRSGELDDELHLDG
jgi:hypothetical protein